VIDYIILLFLPHFVKDEQISAENIHRRCFLA